MKYVITISIIFMFSLSLLGQNDSIQPNKSYRYYDKFNDYWSTVTFKIGGGMYLPQGKLKNYFKPSALFELSLDFPVTDSKSLELALQFIIPEQIELFQYLQNNENIEAEASLIVNPMLRFKKDLSQSKVSKFILGLGIGASVISTTQKSSLSDEDENYEITAFLVTPSLDYVKSFKNKEQLTFSLGLHYSPYKIEGALQEKIGSIALMPRLLYSF